MLFLKFCIEVTEQNYDVIFEDFIEHMLELPIRVFSETPKMQYAHSK